ncbi:uncharacterized protein M6B38_352070 [Iris pallida]|uniref:Uncharacterized protein n=1 Tax=Iris pallida TaxID=29817 RepID=A0AAX6GQF9_IRIPA|nr:uncharacterized protein M6B38_352070 [Iris pallida]
MYCITVAFDCISYSTCFRYYLKLSVSVETSSQILVSFCIGRYVPDTDRYRPIQSSWYRICLHSAICLLPVS